MAGPGAEVASSAFEAMALGRRAVAGTLYAPGTFPRSAAAAPPIYRTPGGGRRAQESIELDIRLRAATRGEELAQLMAAHLPRFDLGNVVVAFTCAAKVDGERDAVPLEHTPEWHTLQERLIDGAALLEPRGMSMAAYAAARLRCGDPRLLAGLASAGTRRAPDFGATDVAKSCWAFAKLRFVEEPVAAEFWKAVTPEAERAMKGARFVDVSMTAWAFATTGLGTRGLFAAVAAATRAELPRLLPRSLAGIAWAFGRAGFADADLLAAIGQRARGAAAEFVAHDVVALCWGLSASGAADAALYQELAAHMVGGGLVKRLSPPLAAEVAWAFAAARQLRGPMLEELAQLCASQADDLETEDAAGFAWAFAASGLRHAGATRALAAFARRFRGRLSASERHVLSWALLELTGADPLAGGDPSRFHPS